MLGAALGQLPPPCWCCQGFGARDRPVLPGKAGSLRTCWGQRLQSQVPLPPSGTSAVPPPSKSQGTAAPRSWECSHQHEMGAGAGACLQSQGSHVPTRCLWPVPRCGSWCMPAGPCWRWGLLWDVEVVAAGVPGGGPMVALWRGGEAGLAAPALPHGSTGLAALCHDFPPCL